MIPPVLPKVNDVKNRLKYGYVFPKANEPKNRLIHGWRTKISVKTSSIFIIVKTRFIERKATYSGGGQLGRARLYPKSGFYTIPNI